MSVVQMSRSDKLMATRKLISSFEGRWFKPVKKSNEYCSYIERAKITTGFIESFLKSELYNYLKSPMYIEVNSSESIPEVNFDGNNEYLKTRISSSILRILKDISEDDCMMIAKGYYFRCSVNGDLIHLGMTFYEGTESLHKYVVMHPIYWVNGNPMLSIILYDIGSATLIVDSIDGPFAIGSKGRSDYMDMAFRSRSAMDNNTLAKVGLILKNLRSKFTNGERIEECIEQPPYTDDEMSLYNTLRKMIGGDSIRAKTAWRVIYEPMTEVTNNMETYSGLSSTFPGSISNEHCTAPVVKFSDKEWKNIGKWANEEFIRDDVPINLKAMIKKSRYGNSLVIPITDEGKTYDLFVECQTFENDVVGINIYDITGRKHLYDDEHKSFTITGMKIIHASEFVISKCLTGILTTWMQVPTAEYTIRHVDEMKKEVPKIFMDAMSMAEVLCRIIALFAIMYMRPDKCRVINEIGDEKKPVSSGGRKHPSTSSKNQTPSERPIIRRILMTKSKAEKFMREHNKEGTERQYVLETWNRVGHYRKLRNGKTIYIEETTCHRNLPLAEDRDERQVYIKI